MMDDLSSMSTKLKNLMEERGKSAEGLARQLTARGYKCSKESIVKWCDGSRIPNAEALCALCHYFNVSADYLLGRNNIRKDDISKEYAAEILGLTFDSVKVLASLDIRYKDTGKDIINSIISSPLLPTVISELVKCKGGIIRQINYFPDKRKVPQNFAQQMQDMGDMYMMKAQQAFYKLLCGALGYDELLNTIKEATSDAE